MAITKQADNPDDREAEEETRRKVRFQDHRVVPSSGGTSRPE